MDHAPFPGGLAQQGWRDSHDPATDAAGGGILRWDGAAPRSPLADADSQAVAVAALRALTVLDADRSADWSVRLDAVRARVERDFTPEVMALEAGGAAVLGAGSQLGWLLWAGALTGEAATAGADRLLRSDVCTPFGMGTLASTHPAFHPHGYHRGSVWPFDSWLGWAGLRAAGYAEEAERVRVGVIAAVAELGHAPELFAVNAAGRPESISASNKVQAWTVGATLALQAQWDGRTD